MENSNDPILETALAINVSALDAEFYRKRRQAVRNRFLAGLIVELKKLPPETPVWMALGMQSSTDWVLGAGSLAEHQELVKQKTPDGILIKKFCTALMSTRSAISSTARDSRDALKLELPAWCGLPVAYSAQELAWTARHVLTNPEFRLNELSLRELKSQWLELQWAHDETRAHHGLKSQWLELQFDPPAQSSRGPRL